MASSIPSIHLCGRTAFLAALLMCGRAGFGQSVALSLGSASGQPGASVSLPLSYTTSTSTTSGLMWTFAYATGDVTGVSVAAAPAATGAGKSITCNTTSAGRYTCIAVGMNATSITSGTLATAKFTLAANTPATSTAIQLVNVSAVSATGSALTAAGSPATVAIVRPVALSGITCAPTALTLSTSSLCTLSLTAAAPSTGFAVSLGSILSGGTISMPASVAVPAGLKTAQFTVRLLSIVSPSTLQITASAGGVTKTAALTTSLLTTISVAISPASASLLPSQTRQFAATVSGTTITGVKWSISPLVGSISSTGLYTAPASVNTSQTVAVRATSTADATKYASAIVTVNPPAPLPTGDATGPTISNIVRDPAATSAIITWTTNEPSTSQVNFGTSAAGLTRVSSNSSLVTAHRVTLTSLQPSTTYYFQLQSADAAGNKRIYPATSTLTFITDAADLTSGLVGYWRFEEGSGITATDSSGAGRNGTLIGPIWTTGRSGRGLMFDGVNDSVSVPAFDVPGSAMTISAWFKADKLGTLDPRIISKATSSAETDHYFMLGTTIVSTANRLRFRLKVGGTTKTLVASSGNVPIGQWVHAVARYTGSTMTLYLNGVQVGSLAATGAITTSASVPVAIGRNPQAYAPFDGIIDEVRVYNRALDTSEISSLYSSGK
jgi:hypothetical protein